MKKLISKSVRFIPAALCLVLALLANNAKAASSYWDIDGANPGAGGITPDGSWEGAFWSTDSTGSSATTTWTDGDFPIFAADGATGSYTVTADAPHTIAGMQMQTSAGTVTINGAGILSIASGVQGFFSSGTLQINSVLGGTGGYEGQSGTVQLYGINTYSGGSLLNGNLTYFNNASSFGSGTITPVFVAATPPGYSAILSSGGALITLPNNFVISTLNAGINFASSASTPVTCTGTWDLQQTLFLRNNGNSTAPLTLSGVLSGVGGLTVSANNSGTILLSGANNYSGGTSLILGSSGVTLQLGNASALGTGATTIAGGCALDLNGNSVTVNLTVNGTGFSNLGALINNSGTPASISAGSTVTMGSVGQNDIGGSGDMTVNCGITSLANQAFAKVGTGTLTLNGTVSFGTGQFILGGSAGAGTVAIGNASALGTGTFNINAAPATVRSADTTSYSFNNALTVGASALTGWTTLPSIVFGAPGTGDLTFSGNANTGTSNDKTIAANGITVTFSGVISGNTTARNLGFGYIGGPTTGTIVLSGASTYTKTNVLFGGTVQIAHSESANVSGPLGKQLATKVGNIVFCGGTLQYSSANQFDYSGRFATDSSVSINGASQAYNIDVNGQPVTFATALTSSGGTLTLSDTAGGGTLTLSSSGNTYAGGTTINAGTLNVTGAIAGNVWVNGAGILELSTTTALAATADLTLPATPSGNVTLNLSGGTQTINALYFGSTPQLPGLWGASGTPGATYTSDAFNGVNGLLLVNCQGLDQTITPGASSACANSTGNTASVTATSGATYAWSITGGTIPGDPTLQTITYTAGASGAVTLNCVVTSSAGCASPGGQNTTVTINAVPAQTITPAASSVCANSTGNTASVTATSGATYAWSITGGTIPGSSTSQTVTYTAGASGTVTLNCVVTSSAGCASPGGQNVNVTVNALPTVTTTPSDSTTLCSGSSVGLTASGAATYTWSPGTGLSATTGASVTANPTTTTAYTVTGTDANGCQNTATVTVTVQNCSPPNITNIVVNLDGSYSLTCTGVLNTPYWLKGSSDVTVPLPWTTLPSQNGTITVSPFTLTDGPLGLPQQRFYYLTNNAN